jgi:hypothetical protein
MAGAQNMLFPVSGIEVNPLIPFIVAFVVSFFTSMGGVSGAFLLLPFQVSFLGYTAPSVSGTNQVFNIVAIPSGVYQYIREGRMLWPLTWAVTGPAIVKGDLISIGDPAYPLTPLSGWDNLDNGLIKLKFPNYGHLSYNTCA